jgi:hypothetical protein
LVQKTVKLKRILKATQRGFGFRYRVLDVGDDSTPEQALLALSDRPEVRAVSYRHFLMPLDMDADYAIHTIRRIFVSAATNSVDRLFELITEQGRPLKMDNDLLRYNGQLFDTRAAHHLDKDIQHLLGMPLDPSAGRGSHYVCPAIDMHVDMAYLPFGLDVGPAAGHASNPSGKLAGRILVNQPLPADNWLKLNEKWEFLTSDEEVYHGYPYFTYRITVKADTDIVDGLTGERLSKIPLDCSARLHLKGVQTRAETNDGAPPREVFLWIWASRIEVLPRYMCHNSFPSSSSRDLTPPVTPQVATNNIASKRATRASKREERAAKRARS